MNDSKACINAKEKIKKLITPKKEELTPNSSFTIVNNFFNTSKNLKENNLLKELYLNRLHPPPIGIFSKALKFDSNLNFNILSPVIINDKKIILGEGSFSIVQLYEDKKTGIKYAVKKMNSEKIEKIAKNKNLINTEVNIHGRINHPNIIRLHNFFKNKNLCFLILEYAPNGTLFDIIRSRHGLSEINSFYYFLQTLNAIYFLHLHSIIHRDLKPENLLLNEKNIIKLCDFGWSVKLNDNKRTTFCGTVEYMAPEIIKKQKYDEAIDVWSLGVLLYELVHSYSPFFSEDLDMKKIGNNITNNNLKFKDGLSNEYKDLVQSLLIKDSDKRIKIEEIFQHPFMIKYINMIYIQVNEKKGKNLNSNSNHTDIKIKKKKITKNRKNDNNNIINKKEEDPRETETNEIFESIPNEPVPKILPESNLFYNEIKKINTNFSILDKKIPDLNLNLNTSRDKLNSNINKNIKKEKKLFKTQNKISHVKSFSLGQNDPTFKELNENMLKIIISINNTQNKNYINKNKERNKIKKICAGHKKSLSNYFQNYNSNNILFNKINPLLESENIEKRKNLINISSKKNKSINQNDSNLDINSDKKIKNNKMFYKALNKNYTKTDNDKEYQYISMINTNNTNNFSNIIINNNGHGQTSKNIKQLKYKKLKISNSNYGDLKYLCRVNSDSHKLLFNNFNAKNNINNNNNNLSISLSNKLKKRNDKIFTNKNIFQSSIDNINKNVNVSFIDEIVSTNNNNRKDLNIFNNKSEIKNETNNKGIIPNLKKDFFSAKKYLNFDINKQNSNNHE